MSILIESEFTINVKIDTTRSLSWEGWLLVNTTDVGGTKLDVTFVTPAASPRVLDEEVVFSTFGSVSDSEDTVVEGGSALGRGNDTRGVHLEDRLVGLNGDGNWSSSEGSLKVSTGGVLFDIGESNDFTNSLGGIILALVPEMVSSSVWIVSLEHEWALLDVLESVVHKTTVATLVNFVAVDELLLGEGLKFAGGNEFSTLDGTGGGESPA